VVRHSAGRWIGDTEFELLWRDLGTERHESLLDVGCGTGWFTRRFAAAGLAVIGLDIDSDALAFAGAQSGHAISDVEGDVRCLPFPDQSFDHVSSIAALCFVDEWPRAIAEIVRVARRRFVLGLLNRHSPLWLEKHRGDGRGAYHGAIWHTRRQLDAVLKELPIAQIKFSSAIFHPSGTSFAQRLERMVSQRLPWGAFLVVSGMVAVRRDATRPFAARLAEPGSRTSASQRC
jgi:ubiquinone/menaquinone biosynthesis C-methylase UbiE